jgi:hypothetical protein|tara:strand:- start:4674 stop:4871 length:198 start_codon:yes stop_codon:yes gene_type:complete
MWLSVKTPEKYSEVRLLKNLSAFFMSTLTTLNRACESTSNRSNTGRSSKDMEKYVHAYLLKTKYE